VYKRFKKCAVENIELLALAVVACLAFAGLWNLLLCHRPVSLGSSGVAAWWTLLCGVCVVNICGWQQAARWSVRRSASAEPSVGRGQRSQLLLSAVFVLGCGFRSLFPRADVQRLGLIDSWLSSVLVGRSVATLAELCFVGQWALLLHAAARDSGSRFGVAVAWLLVPLIVVAEVCSWSAVLTTCYLGNVIEECLWAFAASLLVVSCLLIWSRCRGGSRPFVAAAVALGTLYVLFMSLVDIPMYAARWQADEASRRAYLTLDQGLRDAWSRRVVTFSWEKWQSEIPWMTLYFSVCVWASLALVLAPRFKRSQPSNSPEPGSPDAASPHPGGEIVRA
jgi:hypothetical protein